MIDICNKNILCCGCSEMDTCTKKKQEILSNELFNFYGSFRKQYNTSQFYISCEHPENIETEKEIKKWLSHADADIEKLELYIARLQAYKMELVKRYNYLMTRPTKEKIKLHRYKKYQGNVFYYIIFYLIDLETGEETETDRKTYKGTERKQAFIDFESIIKKHPDAVIEKDINKSKFER